MIDVVTLAAQLPPLDWQALRTRSAEADAPAGDGERRLAQSVRSYLQHYGLDFEARLPGLRHHLGTLEVCGFRIACHYWCPPAAKGSIFVLHGYYDHVGLYRHAIEFALLRGYAVVSFDLPGHGLSSGEQASIASFSAYQEVLDEVVARFAAIAPLPWYAMGQSTGGAILAEYLLRDQHQVFEKAVLLAPLYAPAKWRSGFLLHALVSPLRTHMPRRFNINSGDKEFLHFLRELDPLQSRRLSLRWVGALKRWMQTFRDLPPLPVEHMKGPLLIQGELDGTVAWRHNLPVYQRKFPRLKVVRLREARHELVNETAEIRAKLFAAIDLYFSTSS